MCSLKLIRMNIDYVHWLFNKFSTCILSHLWDINFDKRIIITVNDTFGGV